MDATMTSRVPFEGLLIGCSFFVGLVVAFDLFVLVGDLDCAAALPAAFIGAALALAAMITLGALLVAGRRSLQRMRAILAGNYLVRWRYNQGEWRQFILQEGARSIRGALLFLPISLLCAALLALLSAVFGDPFLMASIPLFLLFVIAFCASLAQVLAGRRAFMRRARLAGDAYISHVGVIRPDGYRSLHPFGYHLVTVRLQPGAPTRLRFVLEPGRAVRVLGVVGAILVPVEVVVPVPDGHEDGAAQLATQLLRPYT
jgi:hypothetical protein